MRFSYLKNWNNRTIIKNLNKKARNYFCFFKFSEIKIFTDYLRQNLRKNEDF